MAKSTKKSIKNYNIKKSMEKRTCNLPGQVESFDNGLQFLQSKDDGFEFLKDYDPDVVEGHGWKRIEDVTAAELEEDLGLGDDAVVEAYFKFKYQPAYFSFVDVIDESEGISKLHVITFSPDFKACINGTKKPTFILFQVGDYELEDPDKQKLQEVLFVPKSKS